MEKPTASTKPIRTIRTINSVAYGRVLPAMLWLVFSYGAAMRLSASIGSDDWLLMARLISYLVINLITVVLFLIRYPVKSVHARPLAAFIAILASLTPSLIALQPLLYTSRPVLVIGNLLSLIGIIWSMASVLTLGRCFGLFPEVRGLVTRGPYRIVRHPLYLGEFVGVFGILLPVISPISITVYAGFVGLQIWRSYNEERALEQYYPEYRVYKSRTPRILPFIW